MDTSLTIESLRFYPNGKIVVQEFSLETQDQSNLLSFRELNTKVNLIDLFKNQVNFEHLELKHLSGNITEHEELGSNYDFIINAFSSETEKEPNTSPSEWNFSINQLTLHDFQFNYLTPTIHSDFTIGHLSLSVPMSDLSSLSFEMDELLVENSSIDLTLKTKEKEDSPTTESITPSVKVNSLLLSSIDIHFVQDKDTLIAEVGELEIKDTYLGGKKIELSNQNLLLANSSIQVISTFKEDNQEKNDQPLEIVLPDLTLFLGNIHLDNNKLVLINYDSLGAKTVESILSHQFIAQLTYENKNIALAIHDWSLDFSEKLHVTKFFTEITANEQHFHIHDLNVATSASSLTHRLSLSYENLTEAITKPKSIVITELNLISTLNLAEIDHVLEKIKISDYIFPGGDYQDVSVNTSLSGNIDSLQIAQFDIKTGETWLSLNGLLEQITEEKNRKAQLDNIHLKSGKAELNQLLGKQIPKEINLPNRIELKGNASATPQTVASSLILNSSSGKLSLEGKVSNYASKKTTETEYDLNVTLENLDAGYLLKQPDSLLGKMSLTAKLSGSGLNKEEAKIDFYLDLAHAQINRYNYHLLQAEGHFENRKFSGLASIHDNNLDFDFKGLVFLDKETPEFRFDLDLNTIHFHALNLMQDTLSLSLVANSNFSGKGLNEFNGSLHLDNTCFSDGKSQYDLERLELKGVNDSTYASINLDTDFALLTYEGNFPIGDMGKILKEHFHQYFAHPAEQTEIASKAFNFHFRLDNHPLLTDILIKDLNQFDSLTLYGKFSGKDKLLDIQGYLPLVEYKNFYVDTLDLIVNSNPEKIDYRLGFEKFKANDLQIINPYLSGEVLKDTLLVNFYIPNEEDPDSLAYALESMTTFANDTLNIKLIPDRLILNYLPIQVNPENQVTLAKKYVNIQDLNFKYKAESLKINSVNTDKDSLFRIAANFNEFKLSSFTNIITTPHEEDIVESTISGTVNLDFDMDSTMRFESKLDFDYLHILGNPIGNLGVQMAMKQPDLINYSISLLELGHNFNSSGSARLKKNQVFLEHQSDIAPLNLAVFAPFLEEQLNQLSGELSGKINVAGNLNESDLKGLAFDGKLIFQETVFSIPDLNVPYQLKREEIQFNRNQIDINKVTLKDSLGNDAFVTGKIDIQNINNPKLNINIGMNNFLVFNKPASDTALFYGKLFIKSDMKVVGRISNPVINAKTSILDKSDVVFTIPGRDPVMVEKDGLVTFFSIHDTTSTPLSDFSLDSSFSEIKGVDLIAELDIDKRAKMKIFMDDTGKEFLELAGTGKLNFAINPSGKITMTGRYEIESGFYQMTYFDFVRRKFNIDKGSYINWTGEPLLAELNIRTYNIVSTSPYNLIRAEVGQLTPEKRVLYSRSIPFHVYLTLKGELMKPELAFHLEMPRDRVNFAGGIVNAKLQQINTNEGEVNKQAFALIALGRFIPESTSFSDPHTTGMGTTARNSIGQVFTQQLNEISGRYLKGVDLQFDMESHEAFTDGNVQQQTDLDVKLSRAMFDNRLIINVESTINLEGNQQNQNDFLGDVSLEYKLTDDGVYRMRAFRKGVNERILGGLIVETGVGFVYNNDFNQYRDMFKREQRMPKQEDKKDDNE
jgi:autotransporter translocation and assembly factor TamB